jgi:hypothetical protein
MSLKGWGCGSGERGTKARRRAKKFTDTERKGNAGAKLGLVPLSAADPSRWLSY